MLTAPLRDRFGVIHRLEFYTVEELKRIIARSAKVLDVGIDDAGATALARRSRGTPRLANRLLKRVRDFAQVKYDGYITEDVANYVERIIVMNKGKVMFDDVPHRVFSHVKELEAVGLAAPQVTYILHQLKDNGFDVDPSATTIEEAKETILQAVRKNSK